MTCQRLSAISVIRCCAVLALFVPVHTAHAIIPPASLPGTGLPGVTAAHRYSVDRDAVVSGTVRTENGSALPGATISITRDGETLIRYGAVTDAEGWFRIRITQPGVYLLRAAYLGYASEERRLDLDENSSRQLDIRLNARTLTQPEVVVSTRRARRGIAPITLANIDSEDIRRQPDMKDLPVHLSRTPSITYHSENGNAIGYSTLRMRGFDQRRLAVSINGIPQNDPEDFNVFWINFFDIQGAVQDIQIQRGAGSSVYGPTAIGGAINIRAMPYRPDFYATASGGAGAFETYRLSAEINSGLIRDRYVVFGRFSRLESGGYRDWSWTEFTRFFAGATRYGNRSTLTVQAYGGPQTDGLAFVGIPKAANKNDIPDGFGGTIDRRFNFSARSEDTENFHQPHAEIHHEWEARSDLRFKQSLFWVKGEGHFDFGATFRSADYLRLPDGFVPEDQRSLPLFISKPDVSLLFRAYLDQWQVGWIPSIEYRHGSSRTTIGLEGRLHRSLRWGRIQEATGVPDRLVGSENDVRVYSFRAEKAIAAGYISHLNRLHDRWALQADVQATYRHYRLYDEQFFGTSFKKPYVFLNPRLGLTYNPDHAFTAFASVALAGREPRLKSLYDGEEAGAGFQPRFERHPDGSINVDSPLVVAESLVDVELGARLKRSIWQFGANGFLMTFRDEIVPSGGLDQFGVPRSGNAESTRHVGVELDAAVRPVRGLNVRGNLTMSRNRFKEFTEFGVIAGAGVGPIERDGNPIAGFPDRMGSLSASYTRQGISAGLYVSFVGRQYVDNGGGKNANGEARDDLEIEPYSLVDATFRYRFQPSGMFGGLELGLDLNNVLDSRVLTWGNMGATGPQFFPAATRHAFAFARYTIR